ncbi:MAG TPA: TetR/AcrR family transcriptional regulator [Actinomycetota bacterium]|nr:TetR/AcrR family transcriptional regulator [Actinomycetota bacterium]
MARTAERTRGARRAEMVRVAARLFSERGYHGTSMQHLGDALGLLRGSLYAHIGSKEELLFEVADEGADRFLARGEEAVASDLPAAERLRLLLVGHVETAANHLDAATVFLNEWRYLSADLRAVIQEKRDRYEAMVAEIVSDGTADGEFRADADPRLAVLLVLSAANWTYEWYRPGGRLTPAEVGERFAALIVDGLRAQTKGDAS